MRPAALIAVLALSACVETLPTLPPVDSGKPAPQPVPPAADTCGAQGLQILVGQNVALFESQARSGPSRVIRPGQAVTQDYSEARVNVTVDTQDRITRIYCG